MCINEDGRPECVKESCDCACHKGEQAVARIQALIDAAKQECQPSCDWCGESPVTLSRCEKCKDKIDNGGW